MASSHEALKFRKLRERTTAIVTAATFAISGGALALEACGPFGAPPTGTHSTTSIEYKFPTPGQNQYQEFQRIISADINLSANPDVLQEVNGITTNKQVQQDFVYERVTMTRTPAVWLDPRAVSIDQYFLYRTGERSKKDSDRVIDVKVYRDAMGNVVLTDTIINVDQYGRLQEIFKGSHQPQMTSFQLEQLARGVIGKPVVWHDQTPQGITGVRIENTQDVRYLFSPNGQLEITRVPRTQ